jgi:putative sigma-54 modulation protein
MSNTPDLSKINMQGIHVSLTPALQNSIQLRFAALLRHDAQIVRINVRLHRDQTLVQGHHYTATAQVEVRGPDLVAHADDLDAYAALDHVAQKLDQLLARKHNRRKERRNHLHDVEIAANIPKISQITDDE